MHDVLNLAEILGDELVQRREEGYDVAALEVPVRQAIADGDVAECARLYNKLDKLERRDDWSYEEPSTREAIDATLADSYPLAPFTLSEEQLRDRLLAAWLGRCAGCNLGKPVEGWQRAEIRRYLEHGNAYPLTDYIPKLDPMPEGYVVWREGLIPWGGGYVVMNGSWQETTRGNIHSMARDDDTDYTILGLHILERYGPSFTARDVATTWLHRFPFLEVYTAERAAYRNLIYGLQPPATANYRNPYREWIGAQIRADMWGYVSPGAPRRAAALAFQDASLSHVQNGIYGEMWASALIAACFVAPNMTTALEAALAEIPPASRLAEALRDVLQLRTQGLDWEAARDVMEDRFYGKYSFVHTINNAAVVSAALLWGENDFTRTIALAVQGGWDTDCNGATAGSAFGAMHGTRSLPAHWTEPLHDRIRSSLAGFDMSRISDLAERTLQQALQRL